MKLFNAIYAILYVAVLMFVAATQVTLAETKEKEEKGSGWFIYDNEYYKYRWVEDYRGNKYTEWSINGQKQKNYNGYVYLLDTVRNFKKQEKEDKEIGSSFYIKDGNRYEWKWVVNANGDKYTKWTINGKGQKNDGHIIPPPLKSNIKCISD